MKNIKYINPNQVRKTLSNTSFEEDNVYQAHSIEQNGFIPYVPKQNYDRVVAENDELKKLLKDKR